VGRGQGWSHWKLGRLWTEVTWAGAHWKGEVKRGGQREADKETGTQLDGSGERVWETLMETATG
jgi:hypothetical protein